MQIGRGVHQIERVHQVEFLVSGLQLFSHTIGSKYLWHSTQQKQNTWLQVKYPNEILQIFHMDSFKSMETTIVTNWRKEDATSGDSSGCYHLSTSSGFNDVSCENMTIYVLCSQPTDTNYG